LCTFKTQALETPLILFLSLVDPEVYEIPMLLMIGWRGEPGVKDEPQHVKQGRVMEALLDSLEVPYEYIDGSLENAKAALEKAFSYMKEKNAPFTLLVKQDAFDAYKLQSEKKTNFPLNREGALKILIDELEAQDVVVSTTGKTSREVFEYRKERGDGHQNDFLTVGSMGHTCQIALGIALEKRERNVFCLDGDGSALMHLGSLAICGQSGAKNFKHVLINNGAHDSVGGQPTLGFEVDFEGIFKACGYKKVMRASTPEEIKAAVQRLKKEEGPAALEIQVNKGARKDLGRPTIAPKDNKLDFMKMLQS
jgi:phosphonopyruvate decarboxylase